MLPATVALVRGAAADVPCGQTLRRYPQGIGAISRLGLYPAGRPGGVSGCEKTLKISIG